MRLARTSVVNYQTEANVKLSSGANLLQMGRNSLQQLSHHRPQTIPLPGRELRQNPVDTERWTARGAPGLMLLLLFAVG